MNDQHSSLEVMSSAQDYDQPLPGMEEESKPPATSAPQVTPPRDFDEPGMPTALAQLSYRVDPRLLYEFKRRVRRTGTTVQDAGAEALMLWLRAHPLPPSN